MQGGLTVDWLIQIVVGMMIANVNPVIKCLLLRSAWQPTELEG